MTPAERARAWRNHKRGSLVSAVLVAYLEKNGLHYWQGTEEKLYEVLTKFKNDDKNTPDILRAMAKIERARKAVIDESR